MVTSTQSKIAVNRRAYYDYKIVDKLQAGLVLHGSEVKSIRSAQVDFKSSYIMVDKRGECWWINGYVAPFKNATFDSPDPRRSRKLLLQSREIRMMALRLKTDRLTIVPLEIFFRKSRIKLLIGLGVPKKLHDKRNLLRTQAAEEDIKRSFNQKLKKG